MTDAYYCFRCGAEFRDKRSMAYHVTEVECIQKYLYLSNKEMIDYYDMYLPHFKSKKKKKDERWIEHQTRGMQTVDYSKFNDMIQSSHAMKEAKRKNVNSRNFKTDTDLTINNYSNEPTDGEYLEKIVELATGRVKDKPFLYVDVDNRRITHIKISAEAKESQRRESRSSGLHLGDRS